MGFYINPEGQTKEEFLIENQTFNTMLCKSVKFEDCPEDQRIIMWVDNGPFTAALICYNKQEFEITKNPSDHRPKWLFFVPAVKLEPFIKKEFLYGK